MAEAQSILDSTKKLLGLDPEDDAFDIDVIMHINSVFSTLNQLGLGPVSGFSIEDKEATWEDYIGAVPNINSVKTYMYQKLRLIFDPPQNSFLLTAIEKQILEYEVRLNMVMEGIQRP